MTSTLLSTRICFAAGGPRAPLLPLDSMRYGTVNPLTCRKRPRVTRKIRELRWPAWYDFVNRILAVTPPVPMAGIVSSEALMFGPLISWPRAARRLIASTSTAVVYQPCTKWMPLRWMLPPPFLFSQSPGAFRPRTLRPVVPNGWMPYTPRAARPASDTNSSSAAQFRRAIFAFSPRRAASLAHVAAGEDVFLTMIQLASRARVSWAVKSVAPVGIVSVL